MNALAHWFGLDNASGPIYLWWSGFFGDVSIFAGMVALYRHANCHQSRCWRIGRHPAGPYKVCAHHHPAVPGKVTAQHIAEAHRVATPT